MPEPNAEQTVAAKHRMIGPVTEGNPTVRHRQILVGVVVVVDERASLAATQRIATTGVPNARRRSDIGNVRLPLLR